MGNAPAEIIGFLKEYIVSPKHVGALCPSSKLLAELITETARVREAATVVEFGPGTGSFTEQIIKRLQPDARFFAMEINEGFAQTVRKRFPGIQVHHDSAVNTRKYLRQIGVEHCDCIVSGLPFTNFQDELQDELLDTAIDVLRPGGLFVTFAYVMSPCMPNGRRLSRKLRSRFSRLEKTHVIWRNVLPAFAYCAVK